jgi:hypothetical protein
VFGDCRLHDAPALQDNSYCASSALDSSESSHLGCPKSPSRLLCIPTNVTAISTIVMAWRIAEVLAKLNEAPEVDRYLLAVSEPPERLF